MDRAAPKSTHLLRVAPGEAVKCPACACVERGYHADVAFLAGVAFAFQFNNEAMRRHVCPGHAKSLVNGVLMAQGKVPEADRRTSE